jgi:hypothetical protein
VTDTAEALAETLEAGIARARQHQANVEQADDLALRVAAHEAGLPMEHALSELFLRQYDGPTNPDHLIVAWHRQVLDREPPRAVLERIADRDRSARVALYRQTLEEETEADD